MAKQRILVVEDEWIVADTLRHQLIDRGYEVPATASDGRNALALAERERPDLVLMDIQLGGSMDGIESARAIRERFDIPTLYLTAYTDESTLQRAKSTDPVGYLVKPVDDVALRCAIETALHRHELERQLKENQERLRQALVDLAEKERLMLAQSRQAAMGEMLAMIAHQWRQPLATISLLVTNILTDLELGPADGAVLRNQVEQINRQVQHLSHSVDDFRDFFRPGVEREPLRVETVLEQALLLMAKLLERQGIEVVRRYAGGAPLTASRGELLQLFLSLLQNAAEALARKEQWSGATPPRIELSTDDDGETVTVAVSDNGGGMGEAAIQRMFEPYFTTKGSTNGTGLGLYMSKLIVEKHHGGTIHAENGEEGALLIVTLPRHAHHPTGGSS